MLQDKNIIAIVPARSGSKGIPNKNMQKIGGQTLIGWAGECLKHMSWIDTKIISTDSSVYADEALRHGLEAPFLRPPELSQDKSTSLEAINHALLEVEKETNLTYQAILLIEPTSPFRLEEDIKNCVELLFQHSADSVISVSPINTKYHPSKSLAIKQGRLTHHLEHGIQITARQQLEPLYARNGICYALTRECVLKHKRIFTSNSIPYLIERELVNIDEPIDLDWAEFLFNKGIVSNAFS